MRDEETVRSQVPVKSKDVKIRIYDKGNLVDPFPVSYFTMEFKKHEETKKPFAQVVLGKVHTDPLPFEMFSSKDSRYRVVIEVVYNKENEYCKKHNANVYLYEFNDCKLESVYSNIEAKTDKTTLSPECESRDLLYFYSYDYKLSKEVGCEKIYENIA